MEGLLARSPLYAAGGCVGGGACLGVPSQEARVWKAGRQGGACPEGPLPPLQKELSKQTDCPYMCAYKLVTVKFKWWGLQNKVENFIQKVSLGEGAGQGDHKGPQLWHGGQPGGPRPP